MSSQRTITILAQNYAPETNAAAHRMSALASRLAASGWLVHVVTQAPHHPQNRVREGYGATWRDRREESGITVTRYRPWIVPKEHFALRLLSEALFGLQAGLSVLASRTDMVLASTPYMVLGPLGLLAARVVGARFAWDVRDFTWEYVASTGRRTFGIDRVMARVMRWTARRADVLTTATEGQLPYFVDRPERAAIITNGLTSAQLERLGDVPSPHRDAGARARVVYAGLLGYPQGLLTLIETAALLPDVDVVFVGDGPTRRELEDAARHLQTDNVTFTGYVDAERLAELYGSADILVAHLRNDPAFTIAQPSKVWEYMATGRVVIYAGEGETTGLLRAHDIGLAVPPESPGALAEAVRSLLAHPARRDELARNGQRFVHEHRNRDTIVGRWEELLRSAG